MWDDNIFFLKDPLVLDPAGLSKIWLEPGTGVWNYWPVSRSVFWIQYQLWGADPLGYHLVTFGFHLLSALVLWRGLHYLRVPWAWGVGLLFALHPLHASSAAWATELKNTLSAVFYLLAIWSYLVFDRHRTGTWYALALGLFLCALLSKSSTVMLPVVLILCRLWLRRDWSRRDILGLLPFFLMSLGAAYLSIWFEAQTINSRPLSDTIAEYELGFVERLLIVSHTAFFYFRQVLFPYPLLVFYPPWEVALNQASFYLPLFSGIGGIAVCCWKYNQWGKPLLLGVGGLVVTAFPVLGFFNIAGFAYTYTWDHLAYLPSIPLLILLVQAARRLPHSRWWGGVILMGLSVFTWQQAQTYENAFTLWGTTIQRSPTSWFAYYNRGLAHSAAGNYAQALQDFSEAEQLYPHSAEVYDNRGTAYAYLGQFKAALQDYDRALTLKPRYVKGFVNRGSIHLLQQNWQQALYDFDQALAIDPNYIDAWNNRAVVHSQLGNFEEALYDYTQALERNPFLAEAYINRGLVYRGLNRRTEACADWQKACQMGDCQLYEQGRCAP